MPEIIKRNISITATTADTAVKSAFLDKKHLIVEAQQSNTQKVYVGLSYSLFTGRLETDFDTLEPQQVKFYAAPKGKSIAYVWYYCEGGTQLLDLIASDGSMTYLSDRSIEKEFPYEHAEGIVITPAAGDTSKNNTYKPSITEKTILRGVIFSSVTYLADDYVKLNHCNAAGTVERIIDLFYLTNEKLDHVVMFQKPIILNADDWLDFIWTGAASAGRKIYANFLTKRKTPLT